MVGRGSQRPYVVLTNGAVDQYVRGLSGLAPSDNNTNLIRCGNDLGSHIEGI